MREKLEKDVDLKVKALTIVYVSYSLEIGEGLGFRVWCLGFNAPRTANALAELTVPPLPLSQAVLQKSIPTQMRHFMLHCQQVDRDSYPLVLLMYSLLLLENKLLLLKNKLTVDLH